MLKNVYLLALLACTSKAVSDLDLSAIDETGESRGRIVDLVLPFIGTGGRGWAVGNAFVGATAPFGMVQVGPNSTGPLPWPWLHCSGYHASDDKILAFSHTHLHKTGIPDFGAIGFMPVSGTMLAEYLAQEGYASEFRHESELQCQDITRFFLIGTKSKSSLRHRGMQQCTSTQQLKMAP